LRHCLVVKGLVLGVLVSFEVVLPIPHVVILVSKWKHLLVFVVITL